MLYVRFLDQCGILPIRRDHIIYPKRMRCANIGELKKMANVTRKVILDAVENLKQVGSWPAAINEATLRAILLPLATAAVPRVHTIRLAVASLTLVTEDTLLVNCTTTNGTGVNVTLPVAPYNGQVVTVKRIDANGGTDAVTVVGTGTVITTQHSKISFTYSLATTSWLVGPSSTDPGAPLSIDSDAGVILADNDGAVDLILTLPPAAVSNGRIIIVKAVDAGSSVIVDGNGAETVEGVANSDLTTDLNWVKVVSDGVAWHILDSKIGV